MPRTGLLRLSSYQKNNVLMAFFFSVTTIYPDWENLWSAKVSETSSKKKGKSMPPNVLGTLVKQFGTTILAGGAYQLGYVVMQFVNPQILNLLIAFVQVSCGAVPVVPALL